MIWGYKQYVHLIINLIVFLIQEHSGMGIVKDEEGPS